MSTRKPSTMDIQATMRFFQHRYYRFPVLLFKLFGRWIFQSSYHRYAINGFMIFLIITIFMPMSFTIMNKLNDWDFLMEISVSMLFTSMCGIQFIFTIFNSNKLTKILNRIRLDWEVWAQDGEIDILHNYARTGVKMMTFYAVFMYTVCNVAIFGPMLPTIADILFKNGTKPRIFPVPIEYVYVDMEKYYFYLVFHLYLGAIVIYTGALACDCWFIVKVQHGCGLFAAVRYQLEQISKNAGSSKPGSNAYTIKPDMVLDNLGWCIAGHTNAIQFVELIEDYYSWCFLATMGFNLLLISFTALQVATKTMHLEQTTTFLTCNIFVTFHLYGNNHYGQMIMDHSMSIRDCILNSEWYSISLKTRKMWLFMLLRCSIPCKLTAGKVATLSVQTFGGLCNRALSYFMMLRTVGPR